MNFKRILFKYGKAPVMNKIAKPKMTKEADVFLDDYLDKLYLEISKGNNYTEKLSESLSMKEYLNEIIPFVNQISERIRNPVHYFPIQVMIYFITRKLQPEIAVETGIEKGGSTAMILEAMQENEKGRLYSIDIEKYYKYNSKYVSPIAPLVRNELKDRWSFICGDAQKETEKLLCADVDFFLAGQSHTYEIQRQEGEFAWKHLANGGIFILDRPDANNFQYQNEFVLEHSSEIDWSCTFPEGRDTLDLKFTVFLKKQKKHPTDKECFDYWNKQDPEVILE